MDKPTLLARITSGRAQLDAALARVDEERMPLIVLHGKWSVKDLIGHLAYWENHVSELFNTLRAGKTPEPFELDPLNAQILAEARRQSLTKILKQEKSAYQHILALIREASDQELFDPAHFPGTDGRPFENFISANTYEHYEEHLPEVSAWLKRIA
jgi:hypothetical protein